MSASTSQFLFRHPLIQEVAYNTQLKAERNILHASVAHALQDFYASRLDEFAGLLSYHHEAAGQLGDAASFAARAATWIGSTDSAQAIQYWKKVLRLLHEQPRSHTHDTLRMRASGQVAIFGWREGMTAEETKPFIAEAIDLARSTDRSMISLFLAADGRITVASGGSADFYVARIQEGLSIDAQPANVARIATLRALLCHAYWLAGLLHEALAANDAALQSVGSIDAYHQQCLGLNIEQWMLSMRGRILVHWGGSRRPNATCDKCWRLS